MEAVVCEKPPLLVCQLPLFCLCVTAAQHEHTHFAASHSAITSLKHLLYVISVPPLLSLQ